MAGLAIATTGGAATAKGKSKGSTGKKFGCGSGHGGFKPGNTCGKGGRKGLADRIKAARREAHHGGNISHVDLRKHVLALRAHRRGTGSVSNEEAKQIHGTLKERQADNQARARLGDKVTPAPVKPSLAPHEHGDHEPGHVGHLNTGVIHADPERFQYKAGSTSTGSVGSLAGVQKYDENLGGIIQVWRDPKDNKTYVVNGHNRLDLAKKLGAERVTVRYLDAKDHIEARSIGALTNIAEGRGTSTDAARFFRDTGLSREDIQNRGIPLREKIATDGLALSRLDKPLFDRVTSGQLSPERGAIIGAADLAGHQQQALVQLLDRNTGRREISNGHLRELVDEVKASRTVRRETRDLFGSSKEDESLALHKTKLQETIKKRLSGEKKLFGIVSRSNHAEDLARGGNKINVGESARISQDAAQTLDIFDRLKRLSGPVSRHLNDAAERIHNGENARTVTNEIYKRIVRELPSIIERGEAFGS